MHRLYNDLIRINVNAFEDDHDLMIGDDLWGRFERELYLRDKTLVVISENSIGSDWVEREVVTAFEREKKEGRPVLFPIRLDNAIRTPQTQWAFKVRQHRFLGDFRNWQNEDSYQKALAKLLHDLQDDSLPPTVS